MIRVGMSAKGGGFSTNLSDGRNAGVFTVERSGIEATDAGRSLIQVEPLPSSPSDLLDYWCGHGKVRGKAAAILRFVAHSGEAGATRDDIASHVDMSAKGGGFSGYLSTLRKLNLISAGNPVVAATSLR